MKAKKQLGQNFLHDEHIIAQIISLINPQPNETIIEIGPGHGAISQPLQTSQAQLQLIELDRELIPILQQKFATCDNVKIKHMDALQLKLTEPKLKIVGNLPYNISTPLLIKLLYQAPHIEQMTFMLQKEVVQRICAEPGNKQYGRLSVMLQHRFHCTPQLTIKPQAFNPPPKVDSQIIQLTNRSDYPQLHLPTLEKLVKQAFQQRRKTIRNNLKTSINLELLEQLKINPNQRPETITVQQYQQLAQQLGYTQAI